MDSCKNSVIFRLCSTSSGLSLLKLVAGLGLTAIGAAHLQWVPKGPTTQVNTGWWTDSSCCFMKGKEGAEVWSRAGRWRQASRHQALTQVSTSATPAQPQASSSNQSYGCTMCYQFLGSQSIWLLSAEKPQTPPPFFSCSVTCPS